jgi:hypothetical protein
MVGRSSELLRSKTEPALNALGGATGTTLTTRSCFSARLMRASSGEPACLPLLLRKATLPTPAMLTPAPEMEPVASPSANGISAAWTEPATDFSTKAVQRAFWPSRPETMLVMS